MIRYLTWLLLVATLSLLAPDQARALESAPVVTKRVTATLVSDADSVAPGMPFRVGLRLRIADGWHTYWKNPGDAGAPPELILTLPDGVTAGPIEWPTPRRLPEGPLMTYAYTGEVLLPVVVTPGRTAGPIRIIAHANWLVCNEICVPEEGEFALELPPGAGGPSPQTPLFVAHDRTVPRPSPWETRIAPDGTLSVRGPELSPATVADAWFIPDHPDRIQDDSAQPLSVSYGGFSLALKPLPKPPVTESLAGVLSVRDQTGQQTDVVIQAPVGPPLVTSSLPFGRLLAFAFLGGMILNLMPCVFPVLAMKAVGLAKGAATGRGRAHAVAYTMGVLTTFAALGGALLTARAAGSAAGWGFQFQSPVFVTAMAWLLFGVGLNLSGVFQIGSGLAGAGSGLAGRHDNLGSFFTGLLAVLVATPCTAPFMATAIAAGLAAPPTVTMSVFLTMGLGLASPYVLLSAIPNLGRIVPRPGAWMDVLKQGLAFPMYGAAVWLLWVISQAVGSAGVLATATGFVLLAFAGWTLGLAQQAEGRRGRLGKTIAGATVLLTLSILTGVGTAPVPQHEATTSAAETFSPDRLAMLRAEGRPVFVNMTAAWCVTCLVNERVAISTASVQGAFAERRIAYLKGDWTRQDPAITAYLRQNGRDGVPLYVYYPAGGRPPVVLPQILTEATVLDALDKG